MKLHKVTLCITSYSMNPTETTRLYKRYYNSNLFHVSLGELVCTLQNCIFFICFWLLYDVHVQLTSFLPIYLIWNIIFMSSP